MGVDLHLSGHHHAYYPGWKDGVAYVSQACLGGGPRVLIGDNARSGLSYTVLEFESGTLRSVMAYEGPGFRTPIDPASLPPQIKSGQAVLKRLDLAK